MIEILLNYSLSLYYQMKYESSTKILYDIIINYDSKNKEAYLLLLKILFDINEYNRAKLLIAKINAIFGYDGNELNEFNEINNEIDKIIKRNKYNIERQEKEIFNFRNKFLLLVLLFFSCINNRTLFIQIIMIKKHFSIIIIYLIFQIIKFF